MIRKWFPKALAIAVLLLSSLTSNASLIGDTVTCSSVSTVFLPCDSSTAVVGSGIEFSAQFNGTGTRFIFVDIGANSLTLTMSEPIPLGGGWFIEVGDLDWLGDPQLIVGVENFFSNVGPVVTDPGGDGLSELDLRIIANNVRIDLAHSDWELGDIVSFDFVTEDIPIPPVPVPAAVWLFGSALGVLGWMRRKAA